MAKGETLEQIEARIKARYVSGARVVRTSPMRGGPCGVGTIVRVGTRRLGLSEHEACFVDWGNRRSWYRLWWLRIVEGDDHAK